MRAAAAAIGSRMRWSLNTVSFFFFIFDSLLEEGHIT
jgi:hypothetical protein